MRYMNATQRIGTMGTLVVTFVVLILGLALAGTIVTQSDNARATSQLSSSALNNLHGENAKDNGVYGYSSSGTVFGLFPLMWAVLLLVIMAAVVIKEFAY